MSAGPIEWTYDKPAQAAALAIAAGGAATILGAWFFQYGLGLPPCPLCLEQRIPYYVAIPLAAIVAIAAHRCVSPAFVRAGLGVLALVMLSSAGLGIYHAGIEWTWWPGPQECSGPLAPLRTTKDLLQQLEAARIVRCDEAAWRFLGLSLAGYNALISLALAACAMWGIVASSRRIGGLRAP